MAAAPAVGFDLDLRPADPSNTADQTFLSDLFVLARPHLQLIPLVGEAYEQIITMQRRAQQAGYDADWPGHRVFVAHRDHVLVAMLDVAVLGNEAHLLDIAVHPSAQGQGVGSALIRQLVAAHSVVTLAVVADNPALDLYRRLGFVETARDGVYVWMRASSGAAT